MHSTLGMPSRDDILRVVCSIKLGHTQASDLFRKLNQQALVSYDHQPLYKALSDFGRLLRTIYILRYIDDPEIRASVEAVLANDELEILLPERSSAVKIIAG
ncbi:MAG: Tn3 family transposase [Bacteroidota bacterium]